MAIKIVVLDDGETWAGAGRVLTITDAAYERLCDGEEPNDLGDEDILHDREVDMSD